MNVTEKFNANYKANLIIQCYIVPNHHIITVIGTLIPANL